MLYSGNTTECTLYFDSIGFVCPRGYNTADFLVDLAMNGTIDMNNSQGIIFKQKTSDMLIQNRIERKKSFKSSESLFEQLNTEAININIVPAIQTTQLLHITKLETYFKESDLYAQIHREIDEKALIMSTTLMDDILSMTRSPGCTLQIKYLLERSFKNTIRNPYLFMNHILISLVIGLGCGSLFYQLALDLGGFQNRLGLFFFICTVFSFQCLSSINVITT